MVAEIKLKYRKLKDYKYATAWTSVYSIPEFSGISFRSFYLILEDGQLTIAENYAWDGASGPTWDDKSNMRSSLVHDALYQILRESVLTSDERKRLRRIADQVLHDYCVEDGMNKIRAKLWYGLIQTFGSKASRPNDKLRRKVFEIVKIDGKTLIRICVRKF